jgi:hypothetical protein
MQFQYGGILLSVIGLTAGLQLADMLLNRHFGFEGGTLRRKCIASRTCNQSSILMGEAG